MGARVSSTFLHVPHDERLLRQSLWDTPSIMRTTRNDTPGSAGAYSGCQKFRPILPADLIRMRCQTSKIGGPLCVRSVPPKPPPRNFYHASASAFPQRKCGCGRVPRVLEVGFGEKRLIRISNKIYEKAGLGVLLSEVMRRLCVVRSEGVPQACAQNRVTCKKANPYYKKFLPDVKYLKTHWY